MSQLNTLPKKFQEVARAKYGDLKKNEEMHPSVFGVRLPVDIAEKLLKEDGSKNTPLLRSILIEVIRNQPELFAAIQAKVAKLETK
ncbi:MULTISPECIES: hypothetical protein [Cyanophyceae]|uniref:hypothetical protein n=1 Tax=Cyanophyceae TaxID=3028117 RepID=UPI00016DCE35|nr:MULTISPECIES: hypothetical protein [Cyanophyceae]ACB00902.1 hypothetical protein SYNPCC7002_E0010 [Picosynechococcus sp. PCC 7002]SMH58125.1 hypothetical protein SAMN06272755_3141 [Picosynechococcus sp. OG1]